MLTYISAMLKFVVFKIVFISFNIHYIIICTEHFYIISLLLDVKKNSCKKKKKRQHGYCII
jgi:hypothetical protein